MKTSDKGIALIKEFEGCRLTAYPDPGTGGEPWTIGYGHTGGIKKGDVITQAQADEYLRADLVKFEGGVTKLVTTSLTQGEFDALVSFSYNNGLGNLKTSTLLRKLNAGDKPGAANEFPRWCHAAGKEMPGLVRRRAAERALFLS